MIGEGKPIFKTFEFQAMWFGRLLKEPSIVVCSVNEDSSRRLANLIQLATLHLQHVQ